MKKKTIPIPILIEIIILVIVVALIIGVTVRNANHKNSAQSESQTETAVSTETAADTEASAVPDLMAEPTATPADSDTDDGSTGFYWDGTYTYNPDGSVSTSADTSVVSFPYRDDVSGIVIGYTNSYDGAFLEDSSDEQVYGVAVLVVQNQSGNDLEIAQITLTQGSEEYYFEVSALPQGAIAVVQEKNRKALPDGSFDTCTVVATNPEALPMSADAVSVEETEDGNLKVTNLTDSTIPCARVFYKYYSEEDGVYVGGITYTVKLTELEAGQSLTITPSHYVAGYSRVVMVKTYDTAEG